MPNARIFRSGSSRAVESAFRPLSPFVLVDIRFLDLPVACFLIFSHSEDFLIGASHIINPDVHGAGVNERLTNITTCFFQSLQGCSELWVNSLGDLSSLNTNAASSFAVEVSIRSTMAFQERFPGRRSFVVCNEMQAVRLDDYWHIAHDPKFALEGTLPAVRGE